MSRKSLIDYHSVLYATLTLSSVFLIRHYQKTSREKKIRHPPSPLSLPILGNVLSIPPGVERVAFMILGKQLSSDIVYLRLLGNDLLVLNSAQAASDLLDKRGGLYSDRFHPPMLKDPTLFDWSNSPTMAGYNDLWRHYRRMMNTWLNARAITQFYPAQERQVPLLLRRLLGASGDPQPFEQVREAIFFTMGSSMFQLAYGYHLESFDDPFLVNAKHALDHIAEAGMFKNFLVNIIPSLTYVPDWFPGTGWKRTARLWKAHKDQAVNDPFEWTKAQVASGNFEPSILSALLQDDSLADGLSEEERDSRMKEVALAIFLGGTDTTANALINFIAGMVLNPESQRKAQEEVDRVLGPATLPRMSDRGRLPYVDKIISEVLRWRPILPMAIPHACFKDDEYRGYDIEKGTIVMGNIWAMSRDSQVYEDPDTFNPDRFSDPGIPVAPAFGWGRRKCPGNHFAEASLFILVTSLLSTFNFSRKKDANGKEIPPVIQDLPNVALLEMKPFEFEIQPRSDRHRELILQGV